MAELLEDRPISDHKLASGSASPVPTRCKRSRRSLMKTQRHRSCKILEIMYVCSPQKQMEREQPALELADKIDVREMAGWDCSGVQADTECGA